jgi:hypothetical protein
MEPIFPISGGRPPRRAFATGVIAPAGIPIFPIRGNRPQWDPKAFPLAGLAPAPLARRQSLLLKAAGPLVLAQFAALAAVERLISKG